ncbi:MAG: hypothetical protein ACTHOG_03140 [Marmoricola sp.]
MSDTATGTRLPEKSVSTGAGGSPVLRYAPFVLVAGLLAFVVRFAATPLTNYDTYFHLRFGGEFLDGHWSLWNPGTVTKYATAHWVPTQWSSEVLMAAAEKVGGLGAVAWLFGVVLIGYVVVLYRSARFSAGPLPAILTTLMAIIASTSGLSARPQMISYVLTAVTTLAWLRTARDGRIRWWLVPLTWFWATAHGMWPTGISISVVAALALAVEGAGDRSRQRKLALVPVLSLVAAGITPVGPSLYGAVLTVTSRRGNFAEWGPPVWTSLPCAVLALGFVIVIIAALRSGVRMSWLDTLLIVTALGWALYSTRTVPVAAAMLTPFVARAIQSWLPDREAPRRERSIIATMALVAVGLLTALVPSQANHLPSEPSWIQGSLSSLPAGTALLDDQGYGGYLMWRFPQLQLVMHGYGDTFTSAQLDRISRLQATKPGWIADVRAVDAHWALLSTKSPLAYALIHTQGWSIVQASPDVVLLHAPKHAPAIG